MLTHAKLNPTQPQPTNTAPGANTFYAGGPRARPARCGGSATGRRCGAVRVGARARLVELLDAGQMHHILSTRNTLRASPITCGFSPRLLAPPIIHTRFDQVANRAIVAKVGDPFEPVS